MCYFMTTHTLNPSNPLLLFQSLIGSSSDNDCVIPSLCIGSQHCSIKKDLISDAFTLVNGKHMLVVNMYFSISHWQQYLLNHDDIIRIGPSPCHTFIFIDGDQQGVLQAADTAIKCVARRKDRAMDEINQGIENSDLKTEKRNTQTQLCATERLSLEFQQMNWMKGKKQ
ncbi:hypothetical protein QAD02_007886 [Eretmocerus hayati]|uniref:Uncharacterized protein n=1 Tax=Eretmocerus hayati TaxID=131215 RepID=A0ACC2N592_9HYME|nr:hypothetical protein QAD02_007886 [Eretmocerus hayati]